MARPAEQTRARYPDSTGYVERGGVRTFYEVYGDGDPTVLLLPAWSIVHSRVWKLQIPYLSRHARVITFDGRGNGRSDRPVGPEAYAEAELAADALAVLDAAGAGEAFVVAFSMGAQRALLLAAQHPERVAGVVFIGPAVSLGVPADRALALESFDRRRARYEGWQKFNRHHWLADYADFLRFFFAQVYAEPHSTKQIEDAVGWGMETTPETLIDTQLGPELDRDTTLRLAGRLRCPVLVLHGTDDAVRSLDSAVALARATRAPLVALEGSGHAPHGRDPVRINRLLRDFVAPPPPPRRWVRGRSRRRRALYISSPIGLGHARRDIAIATELRKHHPDLRVDWLAQHPVTAALERHGEHIHPASALLAGESAHLERESGEHDLHAFQALRRMDEILLANFMVFDDLVREEAYDLWIGDEAWDIDYFLHENPELKTAPYVWLTDFVGWLPMPDGGAEEAALTSDYNAEMIEQIARHPRLRDRALFVGDEEDVVPARFGAGLPLIRDWTREHFEFPGYVTGFDPAALADRAALRAELGYAPGERVCVVSAGGTAVGEHLLRRVADAFPLARRLVPGLRMVMVLGPRAEPVAGPHPDGLEVRAYLPDLHRHLAACDLAIVHGGLTTTMELTANRRPFLYFPLRHHFEQVHHVRHRLDRHRAGRCMDYGTATPETIAAAIAEEIGRTVDYRPVPADGAARAAALIAELL